MKQKIVLGLCCMFLVGFSSGYLVKTQETKPKEEETIAEEIPTKEEKIKYKIIYKENEKHYAVNDALEEKNGRKRIVFEKERLSGVSRNLEVGDEVVSIWNRSEIRAIYPVKDVGDMESKFIFR